MVNLIMALANLGPKLLWDAEPPDDPLDLPLRRAS